MAVDKFEFLRICSAAVVDYSPKLLLVDKIRNKRCVLAFASPVAVEANRLAVAAESVIIGRSDGNDAVAVDS